MRVLAVVPVVAALVLAACGDPFAILPATISNSVDTVEMYAVNGTPIDKPSGYLLASRLPIRLGIDITTYNFDFLYRIDSTGAREFVPFTAIAPAPSNPSTSTTGRAGFIETNTPFASITEGLQTGYVVNQPVVLAPGKVMYARSGLPNGCFLGLPYYAKIEILSFDAAARTVKFQILVDINCGYRGLEPGLPAR